MWETDTLPPDGVQQLNRCGLVIVPMPWGARSFRANASRRRSRLCRSATTRRSSLLRTLAPDSASVETLVTFGTAGVLDEGGLRKNVHRVIELFRRSFPSESNVRLRVKITPNSPPVNAYGDPRIDVVSANLVAGGPGRLVRFTDRLCERLGW